MVRRLGVISAAALVVSNMIGTGIFTTTGFLAGDLGSPFWMLVIWLCGALVALAGALCYAEMAVNFPRSGGEYVYLSKAWGPAWGFMDGWVSFFAGFSAPIAAATIAMVAYFAQMPFAWAQGLAQDPWKARFLAAAVLLLLTGLNLFSVSRVAFWQNILTTIKLVVIVGFIVLGFSLGQGDWQHFTQVAERTSPLSLTRQFAVSLVFVLFAFTGWNAATYIAEEVKDPQKNLPRALILGTLLVTVLYVLLNVLFLYARSPQQMQGVVAIGSAAALSLFGQEVAGVFSALMGLSLLATINAMCMIGPRVYYAMAREGAFFATAAKVHDRWHSPWVAVISQGLCSIALVLTGSFESLIYYIGFSLVLFSGLAVAGIFRFRKRADWKTLSAVSFAYPLLPMGFIAASLWIVVYTFIYRPWESGLATGTILLGALIYHLRGESSVRFILRRNSV